MGGRRLFWKKNFSITISQKISEELL